MCWFRKKKPKKIYKIVWKFSSTSAESYTDLIKANDAADAWERIRGRRGVPITLVGYEELHNDFEKVT